MAPGPIRKATPADFPAIHALIAENEKIVLRRTDEEFLELIDTLWVAEHDGVVVGCCCLEIYSRKIAELRTLAVAKGMQGRGFGKALVATAVAEAKARNIPQLLTITSSPEYFESLNFGSCLNEKYALFWNGDKK